MTRFQEQRKLHNYSQQALADLLFVNQTAVSQWDRGVTIPSPPLLLKLSNLYGVSTDYLLGNDVAIPTHSNRIPVLGSIPAGIPIDAVEEILDWEEIPAEWGSGGRKYFGLKVKGDSMYPKYLEGDTVILRKENTCDTGDDCAVMVNGNDSTLKQVFLHANGSMEIRPLNPSYPPRTFSAEEIISLPVSIAGVVVELRRKIK